MKALIYTKTGDLDVLHIKEVPRPTPKAKQVLIRVRACALNVADYQPFERKNGKIPLSVPVMNLFLGRKGKALGAEISGIIEEVGPDVPDFKKGEAVFGKVAGFAPVGGCAEFALMDIGRVARKPDHLSFEEAAAISISFDTALGAINQGKVQAGQEVLIYGASGGVGNFVTQLAVAKEARVTGVCSTRNVHQAYQNGCHTVIDYKKEDFRKSSHRYDVIIGVNGYNPMSDYQKLLKPDGLFVGVGNAKQGFATLLKSLTSKQFTYLAGIVDMQKDYLEIAKELVEQGKLTVQLDRVYPVQDYQIALDYLLTQHAMGKVVLTTNFPQ